jgi:DNA-binding transcriptional LysR family regulator
MNLFHIRYFTVIAKEENLTRAAKILNVAQPALSTSLGKLEKEFGVTLFERKGRNIRLNAQGRILLHYAEQIITEMEKAQEHIVS